MTFPFVFLNTPAYTGNRRRTTVSFLYALPLPATRVISAVPCGFVGYNSGADSFPASASASAALRTNTLPSPAKRPPAHRRPLRPATGRRYRASAKEPTGHCNGAATEHPPPATFRPAAGQRRMREQRKSEVLGEFGILHPRSPESEFVGRDCTRGRLLRKPTGAAHVDSARKETGQKRGRARTGRPHAGRHAG